MAIKCPKCLAENPETKQFCGDCGTPLPQRAHGIGGREPDSPEFGSVSPRNSKDVRPQVTETLHAPLHELTTGSTFAGRYQIIEELGHGGMGRIYRALDKKLNEEVALKLIRPEIASEKRTLERFQNELKLARKIGHPNVGRMHELFEEKGVHFITMEYVPGEDLKSFIHRSRGLTVGTAVTIARQACGGLEEAHRLGIIHRDLKPSNIIIDKEGNAKIMDFGIARSLKEKGITGEGVLIGTPEYMSPEQVDGMETDQRSDIYAVGVILYEMVTGRVPFQGDTPFSVAMKHKSEVPKDPRELNAQLPEELSRLILRCLEKDKERRYPSAAAVSEELEKIERSVFTAERPARIGKVQALRETRRPLSLTSIFFPVIAAIILVVAGLVLSRVLPGKRPAGPISESSVAVLPFEDLSPGKDQGYFCDGMTEELITRLSNIKGLKVPARTSVFTFKGKAADIREIGRKLNVQTVLEGSIRKIGSQLRVTAQLINIPDGFHLWSETYDRELKDVFNIWDEIALTIVDRLKLTLLSEEKARLVKRSTGNLEAYNLYLLGRHFFLNASTEEDYGKAIGYSEQALAKDPGYALAYALQAGCYSVLCVSGYLAPKEGYPKAKEAVMKALEIDEGLAEAHAPLGYIKMVSDWDFAGAEHELKRALELSPGSADVLIPYSVYLTVTGRFDEGIAGFKRAAELNPAAPESYLYQGFGYYMAERFDEAMAQYQRALDMNANALNVELFFSSIYALKGMFDEAVAQADKVLSAWPNPEDAATLGFLGWVYAVSGRKDKARGLLDRILDLRAKRYVDAYLIGQVYAGLGEEDKAFEWLNKAYEERSGQMIFIKGDPWLKNLRDDPRYKELLEKIGFEI